MKPILAILIFVFCGPMSVMLSAQSIQVAAGVQVSEIQSNDLIEISGLVVSRAIQHTLWLHEDSGSDPIFYGIDASTGQTHSTISLANAPHVDWEDMAVGPRPGGGHYLYIGDIGDNGANRNTGIDIIRFREPASVGDQTIAAADYTVKRVTYPGILFFREEDAESLFVDPLTGDIYIIQKLNPGRLFRMPAQEFDNPGTYMLESLGAIQAPLDKPTAADISPDGRCILVRNSSSGGTPAYLFYRNVDQQQSVQSAMQNPAIAVNIESEQQGETIAWNADASGFYSISEGENSPVWFYAVSYPVTNVKDEKSANPVRVYPNPVKDRFTVEKEYKEDCRVELSDMLGRVVYTRDWREMENKLTIDIGHFPAGAYTLHLSTSNQTENTRIVRTEE